MKELTEQGNTQHTTTSAGNTSAKNSRRKEFIGGHNSREG